MSFTLKIGDIFEIPLSNERRAFGQYVYLDKHYGPLIQVFSYINSKDENVSIDDITKTKILFPPIITGLIAAIRENIWKVVGNKNVEQFIYPGFISTLRHPRTNEASIWQYWDGINWHKLGKQLEGKYKRMEYLAVYSPYDIPHRIETGEKPYEKLILTNKM